MSEAQGNPTEAKDIVFHFITKANLPDASRGEIARWMNSCKALLGTYSMRQIISVINHCIDVKKKYIFSFNFIVSAMHDMLMEIEAIEAKERAKEYVDSVSAHNSPREEVRVDEGSAERNRRKASGLGIDHSHKWADLFG